MNEPSTTSKSIDGSPKETRRTKTAREVYQEVLEIAEDEKSISKVIAEQVAKYKAELKKNVAEQRAEARKKRRKAENALKYHLGDLVMRAGLHMLSDEDLLWVLKAGHDFKTGAIPVTTPPQSVRCTFPSQPSENWKNFMQNIGFKAIDESLLVWSGAPQIDTNKLLEGYQSTINFKIEIIS